MIYFAYGSNLSPARLTRRVSSAELLATGQLAEHCLLFHKIGRDGSAKCDASYTGLSQNIVLGALYRIDPAQKKYLDRAEGLGNGYEIKQVTISTPGDESIEAFTYYATHLNSDLKPFHWYKEHVLYGARFHLFPEQYVRIIEAIPSIDDEDRARNAQELEIY